MNQTKLRDSLIMGGLMALTIRLLVFTKDGYPFFIEVCSVMSLFFYAYIMADPRLYKSRAVMHRQYAYWLTVIMAILILILVGLIINIRYETTEAQTRLYNMMLTTVVVLMILCLFMQYALDSIIIFLSRKKEISVIIKQKSRCGHCILNRFAFRTIFRPSTARPDYNDAHPWADVTPINLLENCTILFYEKTNEITGVLKVKNRVELMIPNVKVNLHEQVFN